YAQGWSDGLPLVPASQPLVEKFLAATSRSPDEVIGELEQVGRNCTVYLAAVNAAMAGCLPEYFPVVLAAFDALMRERAARGGGRAPGTSAVSATLLRTCEFVDNRHTPDPEHVLADVADTISRTGSLIFRDTSAGVVFCPEHAQLLADAGYTKADVQAWLM